MMRALSLAAAVCVAGIAPVQAVAYSDLTYYDVTEGTGSACLTGATLLGLTAFFAGPAAVAATVGASATAAVPPATLTTGASAIVGCGASGVAALVYYGAQLGYDVFFGSHQYPLLYPMRVDIAPDAVPPAKAR